MKMESRLDLVPVSMEQILDSATIKVMAGILLAVSKAAVLVALKEDLIFLLFSATTFFHNSAVPKVDLVNIPRQNEDKTSPII